MVLENCDIAWNQEVANREGKGGFNYLDKACSSECDQLLS